MSGDLQTVVCALRPRGERLLDVVENVVGVLQGGGLSVPVNVVIPTTLFVQHEDKLFEYAIPRYRRTHGWTRVDAFLLADADLSFHDSPDIPLMTCRGRAFSIDSGSVESARLLVRRAEGLSG